MLLRAAIAGAAALVIAGFAVLGVQAGGLSNRVKDHDDQLAERVADLKAENEALKGDIEDFRAELDSVGTTTGIEKIKTQLTNLRTCFKETFAAVQQASVQGWVSNYQSGDVEGWLDLGRFSSDCQPYQPSYEGD